MYATYCINLFITNVNIHWRIYTCATLQVVAICCLQLNKSNWMCVCRLTCCTRTWTHSPTGAHVHIHTHLYALIWRTINHHQYSFIISFSFFVAIVPCYQSVTYIDDILTSTVIIRCWCLQRRIINPRWARKSDWREHSWTWQFPRDSATVKRGWGRG